MDTNFTSMKTILFLLGTALANHASGQSAGGNWRLAVSTFDAGGQTSSGGVWRLTGTIGQPDATAGKSTGGSLAVQGGFWPGVLTEPGGPKLTITPLGTTRFTLAWTGEASGYKLQHSTNMLTWSDTTGTGIVAAGSHIWSLVSGPRYYFRLKRL